VEDTKNLYHSSVRLLETSSGSLSSEFLGLASSGIGDKEGFVVLDEEFLKLTLLGLVTELLVVGDDSLADSLTDGHDLGGRTSTSDTDADVELVESLGSEEEDGLVDLHAHGGGLKELEGLTVDTDVTGTGANMGNGGGVLLSAEALDLVLFFCHFFL
tara:strand:- start:155 stop:628 length:474 start_codon:yes stop_codon:yes gene_type:complete